MTEDYPTVPDYELGAGADPRAEIDLSSYQLDSYWWSEKNGIARFTYRNKWSRERLVVDVPQPARPNQVAWLGSPVHDQAVEDPALRVRYYESQLVAIDLARRGAYAIR